MSLKQDLLKIIDSALELSKDEPQTIEIRSAVIKLKQAHGSISQVSDKVNTIAEVREEIKVNSITDIPEDKEVEETEEVVEGTEDTATKIDVVEEKIVVGDKK
mgnify:CR=1 FL=1